MAKAPLKSVRGHRGPALLASAKDLFFKLGYSNTIMEHVARSAGLSKRTIYLYFKNKDELFITVASQGIKILQRRLEALDLETLTVDDLIRATVEHYSRFATEEPEYFRIIFRDATAEMMERVSPELRKQVEEQERACLGVVTKIVEKGIAEGSIPPVDSEKTAVIFWGMVTGILLLSLGGSQTVCNRKTREELITKAVAILREGIGAIRED